MENRITWGILGPGIIAHEFVQDFNHVNNAVVGAVASRSAQRAKDFAAEYQIPSHYEGYDELYADPSIDAIYVATPHNFHLEQSLAALQAGKAVLCEKPLTISTGESKELISYSREKDLYLAEAMWTYFLPSIQKAQEWVEQGRLGKILHVKADFGYPVPFDAESRYYNPKLAGGSLYDMGIYPIAIASLFIKKKYQSLVVSSTICETGVDVDTAIHLDYGDETAQLQSAFRCKLHNHAYIVGEKGYIVLPDFWRARECHLYVHEKKVDSFKDHRKGHGFEFEIASISNDILQGKKESSVVSHETSMSFQQLMEEVRNQFS